MNNSTRERLQFEENSVIYERLLVVKVALVGSIGN